MDTMDSRVALLSQGMRIPSKQLDASWWGWRVNGARLIGTWWENKTRMINMIGWKGWYSGSGVQFGRISDCINIRWHWWINVYNTILTSRPMSYDETWWLRHGDWDMVIGVQFSFAKWRWKHIRLDANLISTSDGIYNVFISFPDAIVSTWGFGRCVCFHSYSSVNSQLTFTVKCSLFSTWVVIYFIYILAHLTYKQPQ